MNLHPSWQALINAEHEKDYFKTLVSFVQSRRDEGRVNTNSDSKINVYPPEPLVLNAFTLTPFNDVKVVILGQDPYHGAGQAQGLSFSVPNGEKIPPSLRNIYKELCTDIDGFAMPNHGNLNAWAEQGVLLLNTVLTVEEGQANSHKGKGWEQFTDTAISYLSMHTKGIVFLLWGKPAQTKIKLIDTEKHHVLTSVHPSPLSAYRGFLGCKHFSQANDLLVKLGKPEVNWQVP